MLLVAVVSPPLQRHELETTCLVIGGGPAGYGAALAAVRGGCPTLLAERHGYLGGMGTAAGLSCHLNHHAGGHDLAGAIYREFARSNDRLGAHYYDAYAQADFFEPENCKLVMESELQRAGGALLLHALLVAVARENSSLDGRARWIATFACKGATLRVRTRYLIDTTGDADACALAGVRMTHGRRSDGKTQPMSMVVQLGGFDPAAWHAAGHRLVNGRYAVEGDHFAAEIARARAAGEWTIPRTEIAMFWSMPSDPTRVTVNGTRINGLSACNPLDATRAELEGRRQAGEILSFFKKYIPGFAGAWLLQTGPQVGVRESRRIVGRATLAADDVRARHIPADSVALCAYPIDIHAPDGSGTQFEKPVAREDNSANGTVSPHVYGIPWGCLIPEDTETFSNLAAAGRCISATHEAAGSFRVMPTCMTLGEAAGAGVALAYQTGRALHQVTAAEIRDTLGGALEKFPVTAGEVPGKRLVVGEAPATCAV
ncbi:pyruvate/2-oxoglutarate dehydrogenase complex, dihydrolipoamide dehydrogenase component [Opitutaceae bacterium TAV1]|nr:pyruvate/2-oxoglutarate dehydrogenase complex, dihydrolipoamide dehydrogenase component [Opitutaceae bacterium TAV1]